MTFFSLFLPMILLLSSVALSANAEEASDADIIHLLNRISFGPTAESIAAVREYGIDTYIEQQLHPEGFPETANLAARLYQIPDIQTSPRELMSGYGAVGMKKDLPLEERKMLDQKQNGIVKELSEAKILRAIMSEAQLQEVMVDFWYNHFNVFFYKGLDKFLTADYERTAIRPYALGKFRDLLNATARHPAMLFYLDNWLNTDPDSPKARGKKIGINENYARELMELHTLGVNGGYTQKDVTSLAHILTGWGLTQGPEPEDRIDFLFDPMRHDATDQIFLNQTIHGGGEEEIDSVIDRLAQHPSTAHHIAYELAQYFVADDPPETVVKNLAAAFQESDGDIAATLRVLFHSPEFWDAKYAQNKFKPPFRFVVSAIRAAAITPEGDTQMLQNAIATMGEPLYRCQTPNGYGMTSQPWLNSDSLLKRIAFARGLNRFLSDDSQSIIVQSLATTWNSNTLSAAQAAPPRAQAAILLSAPEFLYY